MRHSLRNLIFITIFTVFGFALLGCNPTGNVIVNFNSMGGNEVSAVEVGIGSLITIPTTEKTGYSFDGWYTSNDNGVTLLDAWSFADSIVETEITLYAKWTVNQYTISIEENGGAIVADLEQDYGTAITAPSLTKEGNTFVGWFQDEELSVPYVFANMEAEDITVYAKWEPNEFTINYQDYDGTVIKSEVLEFGFDLSGFNSPTNPIRTGYTFVGWDITLPTTMPAEGITLTAVYSINQYTITFEENGGAETENLTQDFASAITAPTVTYVGYTLAGWFQDVEFITPFDFTTMPANDITIYAKWVVTMSLTNYTFVNYSTQYVSDTCGTNIDLYFYPAKPKTPYVDLFEFIALLSGLIDETTQVEVIDDHTVKVFIYYEYTPEEMIEYGLDEAIFTEYVIFDFQAMTVTAPNVDSFDYFSGSTETSFSEGLDVIASTQESLPEFYANVLEYGFTFRIVEYNEKTLYTIPLSLANLFLTGSMFDVITNKDETTGTYYLYGFDTYQAYDIPDAVEGDDLYNIVKASTFDYSNQVTEDSVNFLAFAFDNFYGLKGYKNIDSFIDYVSDEFAGYTRSNFYSKLYEFIETFEDLHTSVVTTGHTNPDYTHYQVYGDYPTYRKTHSQAYDDCNCDLASNFTLTIQDNIAYYQITSFTEEFKTEIERDMATIAAANVDYVVLDLSCNGGGVLAGVLNLLNYLTNDDISMYSSTFGADSSWTYDVAGDLAIDAEFFIITSEYTFSAANLFAALATEAGYAKSIGEPSGGGACSIQIIVLPNGAIVVMSSPMNLSYSTGETVEEGVPVDYYFDLAGGVPTIEELLIICDELSEETPIE